MCGRFARYAENQALIEALLAEGLAVDASALEERGPSYNVSPSQLVLTVRRPEAESAPVLDWLGWGFVPHWAKEIKAPPINARDDKVAISGMYKRAFNKLRCLIPANGFYEWQAQGKGPKQPYYITVDDAEWICFAGIWSKATIEGRTLETCAIITTEPNAMMAPIHNRMPVILKPDDWAKWCNPGVDGEGVKDLLQPYEGAMTATPVSTHVNRPANNDPHCIAPI